MTKPALAESSTDRPLLYFGQSTLVAETRQRGQTGTAGNTVSYVAEVREKIKIHLQK